MLVAADTETHLISPLVSAPPLVCVSWAVPGHSGLFKANGDGLPFDASLPCSCEPTLEDWLTNHQITGHNFAAFDLAVLAAKFPNLIPLIFQALEDGRIHDTMLREKLLDIARGTFRGYREPDGTFVKINYRLADVTRRRLNIYLAKGEDTWRLRYKELEDVPLAQWPPDAVSYAVDDSRHAGTIHAQQEAERYVQGVDLLANAPAQARKAFWMQLMGCWGMRVHPEKIATLALETRKERDMHERILLDEGLVKIETYKKTGLEKKRSRDVKAAREYMRALCEELGVEPKMTSGGKKARKDGTFAPPEICLDEEACEDVGDEVLHSYAQYTALGNVLSKDVKKLECGEIHGNFDSLMGSGRSSCRGFNLQNLRRKGGTRECFVPREGTDFCIIDLDTAELRAFAQVCIKMFGKSVMADVINQGNDAHCWLAANALGRDYKEVLALHEAGDQTIGEERQVYKNANFGLAGGMGEKRFRSLVIRGLKQNMYEEEDPAKKAAIQVQIEAITPAKIHYVREMWLQTWPEARVYLDYFARQCENRRTTTVEQLFSKRWRGGLRYSEAANTMFQGLIADAMSEAGFVLSRCMYDETRESVLYGSRIVNHSHDDLIVEVPSHIGHECALEIQRLLLETVGKWLPDVPPRATPVLTKYWSKKAFPIFEGGRLVPWDGHKKVAAPVKNVLPSAA